MKKSYGHFVLFTDLSSHPSRLGEPGFFIKIISNYVSNIQILNFKKLQILFLYLWTVRL
jgi:hypothetical protein